MAKARSKLARAVVILVALVATTTTIGAGRAFAQSTVTAVRGSAHGYYLSVGLFGGPPNIRGPAPTVTLAADASNSPQTATQPTGSAVVGPATFFSSGQMTASTSGSLGPAGSVASSTNIADVNTSRSEVFGEDNFNPPGTRPLTSVASSCTASGTGVSGSTTITNGKLYLDSGDDVNDDGDYGVDLNGDGDYTDLGEVLDAGEHAPEIVTVPTNPAPNTLYSGHLHVNGSQDNFRYVFNEQVTDPDGSLTVHAGHLYLDGPTAVGDLLVGKAECGVTAVAVPAVSRFTPTASPVGKTITIEGSSFTGATKVAFTRATGGSVDAVTFSVIDDGRISVKVPTGAVTGPVSVTTAAGKGTSATNFSVTPKIKTFTPTSGPVGTDVTITGNTFTGTTKVQFGGTSATFTMVSDTKITAKVPAGAVTGAITITNAGGKSKSKTDFTVT